MAANKRLLVADIPVQHPVTEMGYKIHCDATAAENAIIQHDDISTVQNSTFGDQHRRRSTHQNREVLSSASSTNAA
jgi:hypothetical protein